MFHCIYLGGLNLYLSYVLKSNLIPDNCLVYGLQLISFTKTFEFRELNVNLYLNLCNLQFSFAERVTITVITAYSIIYLITNMLLLLSTILVSSDVQI